MHQYLQRTNSRPWGGGKGRGGGRCEPVGTTEGLGACAKEQGKHRHLLRGFRSSSCPVRLGIAAASEQSVIQHGAEGTGT